MLDMVNKNKYLHLEKTLTIAGITLIIFAVIAALFSTWNNRGFVYEPFDVVYYLRYLLVLCGGHFIGYMFQPKTKKPRDLFAFRGVSYSLLAILIFFSLDVMRAPLRGIFGILPYPWEKIMFQGQALIALAVVALIGIALNKYVSAKKSNHTFKWLFVILFAVLQAYMVIYPMFIGIIPQLSFELLYIIILYIIATPLFLAIVAYMLLDSVKESLSRLFFSAFVGIIYFVTHLVAWEFSTNPMAEATVVFGYVASISAFVLTVVLIWFARKSVRLQ